MGHLPNRSKAMGSNLTLVKFYCLVYFSDHHSLLTRIIIGLAFRNPHAGMERLSLMRMVDTEDRVPRYLLAPKMSDGNR
jgi:hypothetical protein